MLQADRNITDDGYIALWQSDTGIYSIWNLNETGAYLSGEVIDDVRPYEALLQTDINSDGNLGFTGTEIEEDGSQGL